MTEGGPEGQKLRPKPRSYIRQSSNMRKNWEIAYRGRIGQLSTSPKNCGASSSGVAVVEKPKPPTGNITLLAGLEREYLVREISTKKGRKEERKTRPEMKTIMEDFQQGGRREAAAEMRAPTVADHSGTEVLQLREVEDHLRQRYANTHRWTFTTLSHAVLSEND
ncbi:hypothetical protein M407DRAFT_8094 [Tulasnella calospora MUT 4182]|uniref:Uncharacterized protein n=1 Tax=Tulasnella calospora MUT 4182 TaxID=1051891 RepID=A0A0C3Q8B3_9AGAM|nr:hypothetical protein M407DRAFT_8094 [Tulasnella calospora MUT 4182]